MILLLVFALIALAGCTASQETNSSSDTASDTTSGTTQEPAANSRAEFVFSDTDISSVGDNTGFEISGTQLTITASGTYVLSGSCSTGSVTVKKEVTDVKLVLDGLQLASEATSPIVCGKSSAVVIEVVGENTLTDNEDAAQEGSDTFEGAAIKIKSGAVVTLTGDGELTVEGTCKNGIKGAAETEISISNLTLNVTAQNNAIAGDGAVSIESGILTLTSGNDAIKAEPEATDTVSEGSVTISGGTITIVSAGDGIQAAGAVNMSGCVVNICSGGGQGSALGQDDSAKGIKSDTSITITGGEYTLDCADDAIHAAQTLTLTGGTYTIDTGDDALHSDTELVLGAADSSDGPEVTVNTCYEGFEAASITLYSGSASIIASDDGMNAAGTLGSSDMKISIYGGTWDVNAGGDGLDANGSIYIYGGVTQVFGSQNDGDAALDYDRACVYESGTFIAVGMSGMATTPSTGTYLSFGASGMGGMGGMSPGGNKQMGGTTGSTSISIVQGSVIEIQDSAGTVLYRTTGVKNANSLVFCMDSLVSGQTYQLCIDGTVVAQAQAA